MIGASEFIGLRQANSDPSRRPHRAEPSNLLAHGSMSRQTLNSDEIKAGLLAALLGPRSLWERL